jgi:hypothetical protein
VCWDLGATKNVEVPMSLISALPEQARRSGMVDGDGALTRTVTAVEADVAPESPST